MTNPTEKYDGGEPDVRKRCLKYLHELGESEVQEALAGLDAAMRDNKLTQSDVLRYLGARNPPPGWALDGVRTSDELELDDLPMASEGDDGCWVSTWSWVDRPHEPLEHLVEHDKTLVRATVKDLLDAGLYVSVVDGEETVLEYSQDAAAIIGVMGSTDGDYLVAYTFPAPQHFRGRVDFLWGNGPGETVCDYSTSLEGVLAKSQALATRMSDGEVDAEGNERPVTEKETSNGIV